VPSLPLTARRIDAASTDLAHTLYTVPPPQIGTTPRVFKARLPASSDGYSTMYPAPVP